MTAPDLAGAQVLVVDDQESNVLLLERVLARAGYTNVASTQRSSEVAAMFEAEPPDLLLLDLQMPEPDGYQVMEQLRPWTGGDVPIPILVLTADASESTRRRALAAGARDFVTKPLDQVELVLRIQHLLETRRLQLDLQARNLALQQVVAERTNDLDSARLEAFDKLALAAEYRDDETREHTRRVGRLSGRLAAQLGLSPAMVEILERVAPLHDLGKIGIPDSLLLKPGGLTDEEFAAMKEHARIGAEIVDGSNSPLLQIASEIALSHHERWDGSGYPRGLAGEEIPRPGRIVALIDAFDAMTHDRPYRAARPVAQALEEVKRSSGSHFDPDVVAAFLQLDPSTLLGSADGRARSALSTSAMSTLAELTSSVSAVPGTTEQALFEAAFRSSPKAMLVIDDERRCLAANSAACELLGLTEPELLSLRVDDFAPPASGDRADAAWARFLEAGSQESDFMLHLPDGGARGVVFHAVANFLAGRHLAVVEPAGRARSPSAAGSEEERLRALRRYDILDTPPDGAFDRITALAAGYFGVPISIVSVVDEERIWFKSHHGIAVDEVGRDPGLCASAIMQYEPWVISDARADPRTLANPLVAGELGLGFYAGAPLTTRDGHNLGTLCILDKEPRELTDSEREMLTALAGVVVDELELRRDARELVSSQLPFTGLRART